jgi:hypothetical protein
MNIQGAFTVKADGQVDARIIVFKNSTGGRSCKTISSDLEASRDSLLQWVFSSGFFGFHFLFLVLKI